MPLRRKTRESRRHELAVTRQHQAMPTADQIRADLEHNRQVAAALRRRAKQQGAL